MKKIKIECDSDVEYVSEHEPRGCYDATGDGGPPAFDDCPPSLL